LVPITALLVYLFHFVPVIFTYLLTFGIPGRYCSRSVIQVLFQNTQRPGRSEQKSWPGYVKKSIELLMKLHLTATGCHLPYGITSQCYLSPDTSEQPRLNPSQRAIYSIYLPLRDGRLSWPSLYPRLVFRSAFCRHLTALTSVQLTWRPDSSVIWQLTAIINLSLLVNDRDRSPVLLLSTAAAVCSSRGVIH